MKTTDVGIVVPTLGTRTEYLEETLLSIRNSGEAHICVVAPASCDFSNFVTRGLIDSRVNDPGKGLAPAIHAGLKSFSTEIEFVTWIGDDDLLETGSIDLVANELRTGRYQFVWGRCRYISAEGDVIWINKSGRWAMALMRIGPNLVPQPGSMFSRFAYEEVGGLNFEYGWAFDQELFTKFGRMYSVKFLPKILASFRWHDGSLSAGARDGSVKESSDIRTANLPRLLRRISFIWESPLKWMISAAGSRMNRQAR